MTTTSLPKNSTTVRTVEVPVEAMVSMAGRLAPDLTGRWAEMRFLTPRRLPRPAWEREALLDARRSTVEVSEGALPVWTWGSGPTVVLMHGWEGRGSQLGALVEPLVEAGLSVVAFDGPAHGDAPGRTASIVDLARALSAVCARVGDVAAVVAHSLGSSAAMVAASRERLAPRLVMVSPPLAPSRYVAGFARRVALPPDAARRFVQHLEARLGMPGGALDARSLAPRGDLAVMVVHDRDDREVPVAEGRAVAAAWRAERVVETEGLGHRRVLRDPPVTRAVARFIAGDAAERSGLHGIDRELFDRDLRRVA